MRQQLQWNAASYVRAFAAVRNRSGGGGGGCGPPLGAGPVWQAAGGGVRGMVNVLSPRIATVERHA